MSKQKQTRKMPVKASDLIFTAKFYDKYTGEYLGEDVVKALESLDIERRNEFKILLYEMKTGKQHYVKQ